jgi:hypothetical protein
VPEREVSTGGPGDVEAIGVVELPLVEVGRRPHEQHPAAGGDRAAGDLDVGGRNARRGVGRRCDAQHLLDRAGDRRRIGRQPVAHVGMPGEELEAVADEVRGRVVAPDEQEPAEGEQLVLGEALAVDLRDEQGGQEVVLRRVPPVLQQVGEDPVAAHGRAVGTVRRGLVHELVGEVAALHDALVAEPDQPAHHDGGEHRGEVGEGVAPPLLHEAGEELAGRRPDRRLQLRHPPRRERSAEQRPHLGVARRVEGVERRLGVGALLLAHVAERGRIARGGPHVGVT